MTSASSRPARRAQHDELSIPAPGSAAGAVAPRGWSPPEAVSVGVVRRACQRLFDLALGVVLYLTYAGLRNAQGEGERAVSPTLRAERHGLDVLAMERALHLDVERLVQGWVLARPDWVIRAANVYYAGVHLPLTALVFAWLLVTRPHHVFLAWRNVLVLATSLALLAFAAFPTMPPRLLPASAGYADTLARYGGLWSERTPVLEHVEHPYAAMPSLHLVWAFWAAFALWRHARRVWLRRLSLAHVAVTAVVVLVTGNHWLLDVLAGAAVFAMSAAVVLRPRHLRSCPWQAVEDDDDDLQQAA